MNRARLTPLLQLAGLALAAVCLIMLTVGPARAASTHTAATAAHPDTVVTVLRPVTTSGQPVHGWTVATDAAGGPVECWGQARSAVDRDVDICGSSADNDLACWQSAVPAHVLCVDPDDAAHHVLRSVPLTGAFTHQPLLDPGRWQPMFLTMRDGAVMYLRSGGAWDSVRQHPTWVGYYYENGPRGRTVYAPAGDRSGLNELHAGWFGTVYGDTSAPGHHVWVKAAYFVGTAH